MNDLHNFNKLSDDRQWQVIKNTLEGEEAYIMSLDGYGLVKNGSIYVDGVRHDFTNGIAEEMLNALVKVA